jgi:GT2 family glycosyltransferase
VEQPAVTVIIVNWNTHALLERALQSLTGEPSVEVTVVDNASSDGSADLVRTAFPHVKLIANAANRGFGAAVNQGLAPARTPYALLLNSDARLEAGALEAMLEFLDAQPEVAVVGPRLINPDGSIQPSRRRFPTVATAFLESTPLQRLWPEHPLLQRYYVQDRSDDEVQDVDWLVGACLLVRCSAVREVGPLDERFFMYSEELDWCRRIRAVGWRVVYLPQAQAVHEYGKSAEQDVQARHIYFNESKCRYVGKYHGRGAALALRVFLFITFVYQLLEESAKLALGHRPALRRERVRVLLGVLKYQAPRLLGVFG